jgi:hypothetical protein
MTGRGRNGEAWSACRLSANPPTESRAEPADGEQVRSSAVAQRLGDSRRPILEELRILEVDGLIGHETSRFEHFPRLDMHQVDVEHHLHERLQPRALDEGVQHLTEPYLRRLVHIQEQTEIDTDPDRIARHPHVSGIGPPRSSPSGSRCTIWGSTLSVSPNRQGRPFGTEALSTPFEDAP